MSNKIQFRSRKEVTEFLKTKGIDTSNWSETKWLKINRGQAEIHMMALAEAMWDARNESKPQELQPGEWHIPYAEPGEAYDAFVLRSFPGEIVTLDKLNSLRIKISTARCAQVSYTVIGEDGKPTSYENLIDLHNSLLVRPYTNRKGIVFGHDDPIHMSPTEHCAQAMTKEEIAGHVKGVIKTFVESDGDIGIHEKYVFMDRTESNSMDMHGWCHNLRGWKSYRSMIPNENRR